MSLSVHVEYDTYFHGCVSHALSKSEHTGLKITKFDSSKVERWGDEFVQYASRLGIGPILEGEVYPFEVTSTTDFTKMIQELEASN